jgi:hypothetical protein
MLDGEKAVRGHFARFNTELTGGLVKEKTGATHMTGRAHTHRNNILAGWF